MAANDEDKLIISKELADKLKINEETLAQKLGAIVSPIFVKKLEEAKSSELSKNLIETTKALQVIGKDVFSKISAKASDVKIAATEKVGSVVSGIGQAKDRLVNTVSDKADALKESSLVKSLAGFFTGKKETKPDEEKSAKSPSLFQDLFKSLTGFLKKDKEPKAEEKKSLLEEEEVKEQQVIVSNFSQQSLDTLSAILPDAITKGTQHLADSFKDLLEKLDKLIDTVKDLDLGSGGSGGGILDALDMLPGRRGRSKLPGRGTRARNKKAKELRKQRAQARKAKANQGKPSVFKNVKNKVSEKLGKAKDVIKTSAGKEGTLLNKITKAGAPVVEAGKGALTKVSDIGKGALTKVSDIGKGAADKVGDLGKGAANKLGKAAGVVEDVGKGALSKVGKYGGKALSVGGKALGAAGAVLGAGFEFADRKASGQTTTQAAVGTGGTAAGAVAGAVIGQTLIPIPILGAVIGGAVGGWLGGKAADKVTGADEVEKENAIIDEWKENIEKSEPKLGKEYVATYEGLPEDKKKQIKTTLTVNWEGDRESAEDTVKKRLQEVNPKLLYGDKISPELTEAIDKKVTQVPSASPTPEVTVTKPNPNVKTSPAVSPEQTIKENIGSSLGEAKAEQIQQNKEKVQKLTEGLTPMPPPSKASLETPFAFGVEGINAGKPAPELTPYEPEPDGEGEDSEYDSSGKPKEQAQSEPKSGFFGKTAAALGGIAAAAIPGIGLLHAGTSTAKGVVAGTKEQAQSEPKSGFFGKTAAALGGVAAAAIPGIGLLNAGTSIAKGSGAGTSVAKGGGKWGAALKLGLAAAGAVGATALGSKLFGSKEETKPDITASTEPPASATVSSTEPTKAEADPLTQSVEPANVQPSVPNASQTWKSVDFTAKSPAPTVANAADKTEGTMPNDGILKLIESNTKKTSDEVAKLANAFLVFSKMLPGTLANMSVGSNSSPTIISQQNGGGSDKSLRSTQLAKIGNPIIQSFRESVELTRQVPA
jgi:hypothetical protein